MDTCPTVKVKTDNEDGFMIINESDFDETKHELFTELSESVISPTTGDAKVGTTADAAKTPDAGAAVVKPAWAAKKNKS